MGWYAKERALAQVARAAGEGLDLVAFWEHAREALAAAIPHHLAPCWYTLDPASLLVTSHYDHGMIPELPGEWLAQEYLEDDAHQLAGIARAGPGLSTLHEATGGDPSASARWSRFIAPYGGEQELLLALRGRNGATWGVLALYRAPGQAEFSAEEREWLQALAPHLAEGARRGLLVGEATEPEAPDAPGLVIVTETFEVVSLTPGVERWLEQLPGGDGALPHAVLSVAGRALRAAPAAPEMAYARVLSRAGRWLVIHGAVLQSEGARRVAVIVEPSQPARISPLLMAAYGLGERGQDGARQVLTGAPRAAVARALAISPHTVQQPLKAVFEKTGVRTRPELVAKVFFAHYEPRLRDNERRALSGRPLRGGPAGN